MATDNIDTYGVVAGNEVNLNFGATKIVGDVGSFNTISGSGTITASGNTLTGSSVNAVLATASAYYSEIMGYTPSTSSSASNIAGMTFNPGIHVLTSAALTISGATPQVTLDGGGVYIFQVPNGGLTTDPTSDRVYFNFLNDALAGNVYWAISGDVNLQTIGNITSFSGMILCQGNITVGLSSTNGSGLFAFSASPNGTVTFNQNMITSKNAQLILDQTDPAYVNIESTLSDNHAVRISASNVNGGILIEAGFGGIEVNTTNAISLNAQAASNLSTTLGNIVLQSQPALVNLDGGTAINIGCDNDLANTVTPIITPIINIGTSSSAKTIGIGNTTSTTAVTINSGSNDVTLNSNTGKVNIIGNNSSSNAINLDASSGSNGVNIQSGSGGVLVNSGSGKTQITSTNTSVDSIRLDSTASSGGVYITSASGGIVSHANAGKNNIFSANTSVDAIRVDSSLSSGGVFIAAGSSGISIGNDGVAHPVTIGNTTGTSSVAIQSGSWGITIANDTSSGELQLANSSVAKNVTIGNNVSGSRLLTRWNTAWIKHQEDPILLFDNDVSVSASTFLPGLFAGPIGGSLTANRVLTLDTASNFITVMGASTQDRDAFDFTIINTSAASDFNYSLTMGTGGTMIGDNVIYPTTNSVNGGSGTFTTSNSTTFRLVVDVTGTTYTVYRVT